MPGADSSQNGADWVHDIIAGHAYQMQAEFQKATKAMEDKIRKNAKAIESNGKAIETNGSIVEHQQEVVKDMLEKVGILARAVAEEQRRGAERDRDMESLLHLNNNGHQRSSALTSLGHATGANVVPATNSEIALLRAELAELRGQRLSQARGYSKESSREGKDSDDELAITVKRIGAMVMELNDNMRLVIPKIGEHENWLQRMEKQHHLSIVSLSIFSLKTLTYPRDERMKVEEKLREEEIRLKSGLQGGAINGASLDSISITSHEEINDERVLDALQVEENIDAALEDCRDLKSRLDLASAQRNEAEIRSLNQQISLAADRLDRAKKDAKKIAFHDRDDEMRKMGLDLMSYVETY